MSSPPQTRPSESAVGFFGLVADHVRKHMLLELLPVMVSLPGRGTISGIRVKVLEMSEAELHQAEVGDESRTRMVLARRADDMRAVLEMITDTACDSISVVRNGVPAQRGVGRYLFSLRVAARP